MSRKEGEGVVPSFVALCMKVYVKKSLKCDKGGGGL